MKGEKGQSLLDLVISIAVVSILTITMISFKWTEPKEKLSVERENELIYEAVMRYKLAGEDLRQLRNINTLKPYFKDRALFEKVKAGVNEISVSDREIDIKGVRFERKIRLPERAERKNVAQALQVSSDIVPVSIDEIPNEDNVKEEEIIKSRAIERVKKLRQYLKKKGRLPEDFERVKEREQEEDDEEDNE